MKRVVMLFTVLSLCVASAGRAQDAATQERLDKLAGDVQNLNDQLKDLRQENEGLRNAVIKLQEFISKPPPVAYATEEYAVQLRDGIQKVDQNRAKGYEDLRAKLEGVERLLEGKLHAIAEQVKALAAVPHTTTHVVVPPPPLAPTHAPDPVPDEKGRWYTIEPKDTLTAIVQACHEQKIMVTQQQILKANPGLKPDKLTPKTKIWIPEPKS